MLNKDTRGSKLIMLRSHNITIWDISGLFSNKINESVLIKMSTRKFKCLIFIKTHVRLVLKLTITTTKTPKYFFWEISGNRQNICLRPEL